MRRRWFTPGSPTPRTTRISSPLPSPMGSDRLSRRSSRIGSSKTARSYGSKMSQWATRSTFRASPAQPGTAGSTYRATIWRSGPTTLATIPRFTRTPVSPRAVSIISTTRGLVQLREVSVSLSRKPLMIKSLCAAGVLGLLVLAPACTDLTEVPSSSITPEHFYTNETEAVGGLASVYAGLRNFNEEYYNVSEVSTDEVIVPNRGTDWYDNGKWLDIHRQTWTANSPGTLDNMNGAWTQLFNGVARANVVIDALQHVTFSTKPGIVAELRVLRALYYWALMDMFGGVLIVCSDEGNPLCTGIGIEARERNTRAEVFSFIESELIAARPALPASWAANMNGRITQGAADALLASIYVNAQVFTGTVTAAGVQKGTARWADAVTVSDRILNSGVYSLATDASVGCTPAGCGWRSNFRADNGNSTENILVVKYLNQPGLGLNFVMRALHYNQYSG